MSTKTKNFSQNGDTDAVLDVSDKQRTVVMAMVSGMTQQDAAALASVDPTTVSKWLHVPEFVAALNVARQDAYAAGMARLTRLQALALDVLEDRLTNGNPVQQERAALAVLKFSTKLAMPSGETDAEKMHRDRRYNEMFDLI